ncbi:uncharacterized protein V1518DRAFT_413574 [Limtongia smithiae]|uniref:uncharacterized protein n=1 Tax=Limtongia smithiae TaxID=1125753 RepID=UPI0034CD5054
MGPALLRGHTCRMLLRLVVTVTVFAAIAASTRVDAASYGAAVVERIFLFFGVLSVVSVILRISTPLVARALRRWRPASSTEPYSLAHVMLNLDSAPPATWNNMGFWPLRDPGAPPSTDFKAAATSLAVHLADAAALSPDDVLLDVGIGCGDQALVYAPRVRSYIGITSLPLHASMASSKLLQDNLAEKSQIYARDCSDPVGLHSKNCEGWPVDVLNAALVDGNINKVLALDCLIHFQPDRRKFFMFANATLVAAYDRLQNASSAQDQHQPHEVCFAAEDLLRAHDKLPFLQSLGLRTICRLTNTPFSNFISKSEYVQLLADAGFSSEYGWSIHFDDISSRVFPGLSDFLEERGSARDGIGEFLRFEKFSMFGNVVRWWYNKEIVSAYIVSATKSVSSPIPPPT